LPEEADDDIIDETEENGEEKPKPAKKARQPTKAKPARLASATANEKNNSSILSFFQKSAQKRTNTNEISSEIISKFMNTRNIRN